MKNGWKIYRVLLVMVLFCSCERRQLEDFLQIKAKIPVKVFWDRSGLEVQNATVIVYNEDGSFCLEKGFTGTSACAETEIELDPGKYTVFVFNELRDQIDYVRMRGHEMLSTFQAYATPFVTTSGINPIQNKLVNQPGGLAVAKSTIEVTREMVSQTAWGNTKKIINESGIQDSIIMSLTDLHPLLKIATVNIRAHINGLHNARMPALAELRNMSESYLFATDCNSKIPVTARFLMNDRKYDPNSLTDGMIAATISSMGICGNRFMTDESFDNRVYLDLSFQLVDAERTLITLSHDVTDIMEIVTDENQAVTINIKLDMGTLPDVKPEGAEDSGFSSNTTEWDGIDIPVYL